MEFAPTKRYESPNKAIYLGDIKSEMKKDFHESCLAGKKDMIVSEIEHKNRKCALCSISWPTVYVESSITLNVIWETIDAIKNMGLPLGPLSVTANSNHMRPENFHTRIRTKRICKNCVTLV